MSAIDYMKESFKVLREIKDTQLGKIKEIAALAADSIINGGLLHTFGTGHSHLVAEEIFARAGGLVPVHAIREPELSLAHGPQKSNMLERVSGIAEVIINTNPLQSGDTLIIISNSGRNSVPIELADQARKLGINVCAITSLFHSNSVSSRHSSGKKLYQIADLVIDNCGRKGDAILEREDVPFPFSAVSGLAGIFILQSINSEIVKIMAERGEVPPVIVSGNLDQGQEHNQKLRKKYQDRLKKTIF